MELDDIIMHPRAAREEIDRLRRRVVEILIANNRYQEEARAARTSAHALEKELQILRAGLRATH